MILYDVSTEYRIDTLGDDGVWVHGSQVITKLKDLNVIWDGLKASGVTRECRVRKVETAIVRELKPV